MEISKKIRLANIDAPELGQPFGYDSKLFLEKKIKNQIIAISVKKQR